MIWIAIEYAQKATGNLMKGCLWGTRLVFALLSQYIIIFTHS